MKGVLEWPGWLQQLWINVIITLLAHTGRSWERTHGRSLEGTVKTVCWGLKLPSLLTAGSPFRGGTSAGRQPCLLLLLVWTLSFSLLSFLCDTEQQEAKHDSDDADALGPAKSCESDRVLFRAPQVQLQHKSCYKLCWIIWPQGAMRQGTKPSSCSAIVPSGHLYVQNVDDDLRTAASLLHRNTPNVASELVWHCPHLPLHSFCCSALFAVKCNQMISCLWTEDGAFPCCSGAWNETRQDKFKWARHELTYRRVHTVSGLL